VPSVFDEVRDDESVVLDDKGLSSMMRKGGRDRQLEDNGWEDGLEE
jgi:hypothetical protein